MNKVLEYSIYLGAQVVKAKAERQVERATLEAKLRSLMFLRKLVVLSVAVIFSCLLSSISFYHLATFLLGFYSPHSVMVGGEWPTFYFSAVVFVLSTATLCSLLRSKNWLKYSGLEQDLKNYISKC